MATTLVRAARGEHVDVFVDLHAQLARRHDDERLDAVRGVGPEPLDDGDAEAEGLAGAGLGLADDVLAGEAEGDGLLLDGERVDDALGGESLDDVLVDAEFGEGRHDVSLSGSEMLPGPCPGAVRCRRAGGGGSTPFTQPQAREPRSDAGDCLQDTGARRARPLRAVGRRGCRALGCRPW